MIVNAFKPKKKLVEEWLNHSVYPQPHHAI